MTNPTTPAEMTQGEFIARFVALTDFRFDRGNMPWRESLVLRPEGV